MDDVRAILEQAIEQHQAGHWQAAEPLYRRVLESHPDHWDTNYLLGTALLQGGRFEECLEFFRRVVAARPDVPDAQNNLGVAYQALGRWEEAARAFQAAIQADPEYDQAFFNLGALMQDRKLYADAEKCYRHALAVNPNDIETQFRLGNVLSSQRRWREAEECYRETAVHDPQNLEVHVNLAYVLARQERLDEAADVYRQVLAVRPDYHQVHNSLSYVYERQGKLEQAVASARRVLEIDPQYPEGYNNLGTALRSQHRLDAACEAFCQALALRPDFALAEFNLGTTLLLQGRYGEGWSGYQRHAETLDVPPRRFVQPLWNGEPLEGGRLFVYADQGFGDTLQFVRFLKPAKAGSRAEIVFECPRELERLLEGVEGIDRLIVEGSALPAVDFQVPLANLAGLLGVELDSIPAEVPYIHPPDELLAEIKRLLNQAPAADVKVGLVWQGNPEQARDVVRSCPLEQLVPLAGVRGVSFFSLQVGEPGVRQMAALEEEWPLIDVGSQLVDFAQTAAVLGRLDLLITVDTATAHLAGALGRPVWTLLSYTPDWRWLLDRSDSPWYPTMRLFRQPSWGEWKTVAQNVAAELEALVSGER